MNPRKCDVDGCNRNHQARGLCFKHYQRWRRERLGQVLPPTERTNAVGATIVGVGELPPCPTCHRNTHVVSWDGDGRYVCVNGCRVVVFRGTTP